MGRLGDLATIIMGQSPQKADVSFSEIGLPLLNGPTEFGHFYPTPVQWTSGSRKTAEPGDLLFCVRGSTTGRMNWADRTYAIGRGLAAIRAKRSSDQRFVRAVLEVRLPELLQSATGSTFPNVSRTMIEDIEIDLPTVELRSEISSLLCSLDDKIESNLRQINIAGQLVDQLAIHWSMDSKWCPLSKIASQRKVTVNPKKLENEEVALLSIPAYDNEKTAELVPANSIMSNKLHVKEKSILISRLNPRFFRSWFYTLEGDKNVLASTEFIVLASSFGEEEDLASIWLAIRHPSFQDEMLNRVTGTSGSHQRVRPEDVLSIEVPDFSELPENRKRRVLTLLKYAGQLRRESQKLKELRDTLLPELLSGRITPEQLEAGL